MQTFIKNLADLVCQEVEIKGWLYNKRSSGPIAFLELRDGYGWVQGVVVKNDVAEEVWQNAEKLTQESSLEVWGVVTKHPKKDNVFELQVKGIKILSFFGCFVT